MRLVHPESGRIQQGSIFNCAYIPGYENCKAYGIVLTARCDLEHNKHSVINYLPVVQFADWAHRGLVSLLARRIYKDLHRDIENALIRKGVSEEIRRTFPIEDVITRETSGNEQKQLLDKHSKFKLVSNALSLNGTFCSEAKEIVRIAGKNGSKIVEELIEQKLGEFYFIENVDVCNSDPDGFVVLMRNMQSLPCKLMDRIIEGLSFDDVSLTREEAIHVNSQYEPICMVTGVLRSPDIEHLTQQFANLFVRIGLEDQSQTTVERHIALLQLN